MLRTLILFVSFPLALSAQAPTLKTLKTIGLVADQRQGTGTPKRSYRSIPANTPIRSLSFLELRLSSGFANVSSSTRVDAFLGAPTSTVILEESGRVQDPFSGVTYEMSTGQAGPRQPHEWLLAVPARALGNTLSFTVEQPNGLRNAFGAFALDIGNNGQLDVVHDLRSGRLSRRIALGTRAVQIRIATYGHIPWGRDGAYGFRIGLRINPRTQLKFTNYSPTCGMVLTARDVLDDFGHHFEYRTAGGYPLSPIFFDIGFRKANLALPGSTCVLRLDPAIIIARVGDAKGQASLTNLGLGGLFWKFPDGLRGKYYLQTVSVYAQFGKTDFRASNAIEADAGN